MGKGKGKKEEERGFFPTASFILILATALKAQLR